jgi:hypothetical protein
VSTITWHEILRLTFRVNVKINCRCHRWFSLQCSKLRSTRFLVCVCVSEWERICRIQPSISFLAPRWCGNFSSTWARQVV